MTDSAVAHKRAFETYDLAVEEAVSVTPRNKHLRFRLAPGKELHFKAGQFMQMFIPLPDGKIRRSSYSIASSPKDAGVFELCVTLVDGGKSSTYLHNLKPGDKILTMDLSHGGHLTHGNKANFSGKFFEVVHYGVRKDDERIDYDQLERMANELKLRMITVGASA